MQQQRHSTAQGRGLSSRCVLLSGCCRCEVYIAAAGSLVGGHSTARAQHSTAAVRSTSSYSADADRPRASTWHQDLRGTCSTSSAGPAASCCFCVTMNTYLQHGNASSHAASTAVQLTGTQGFLFQPSLYQPCLQGVMVRAPSHSLHEHKHE